MKVARVFEEVSLLQPSAFGTNEPGFNLSLVSVGEAAVPIYTEKRAAGPNKVDVVGCRGCLRKSAQRFRSTRNAAANQLRREVRGLSELC